MLTHRVNAVQLLARVPAMLLGKVADYVADLMNLAALYDRRFACHVLNTGEERHPPRDFANPPAACLHRAVFRPALPQCQHHFLAIEPPARSR